LSKSKIQVVCTNTNTLEIDVGTSSTALH